MVRFGLTKIVIVLLAVLVSCSNFIGAGMQSTITLDEANQKLDDYIERAFSQLPDDAELTNPHHYHDRRCDDPDDQGPEGRKHASRDYYISAIDSDRIPDYFDTLKAWWEENDFRVIGNERVNEFLWVENNEDSFRMTLKANPQGEMRLIASSPCVWPEGTPDPE